MRKDDDMAANGSEGASTRQKLGIAAALAYCAPVLGAGYMNPTMNLVVMKFSTDVLLIAPAVMGLIFSISRISDAILDPIVGYLSDATRSRFGRRRIWIFAGALPLAASFIMVFSPPASLSGVALAVWMGAAIVGFYFSLTLFSIPHYAWGGELARGYHERSRLFGLRQGFNAAGSILALVAVQVMIRTEEQGPTAVRAVLSSAAIAAAVLTVALIAVALIRIKEPPPAAPKAARAPLSTMREIMANPHARLMLFVYFIENLGFGAVAALTLYVTRYIVDRPDMGALVALAYFLPASALVWVWIPLSRRLGKRRLWIISMIVTGVSLGSTAILPFVGQAVGLTILLGAVAFAGAAAGCGAMLAPSILSDIIDHDEHQTGTRKDGSYFAALTFTQKSAYAVMLLATGFVLQAAGFQPNQEQTLAAKIAIVSLFGLLPLICYSIGALLFVRFSLNETEHEVISAALLDRT